MDLQMMIMFTISSLLIVDASTTFICGEILFNISTHLCCGGNLIPLRDQHNKPQSCCQFKINSTKEDEPYNQDTHICCDIVRPRYDGDGNEWHCCNGKRPYRKDKNFCCGNHLRKWNNLEDDIACCGGKIYNIKSQLCCNNTLHHREQDQILENYMKCCGKERYDARNLRCHHSSEEQPKLLNIVLDYCHGKEFDTTTHLCCDNRIIQIPEPHERHNYRCCGGKLYKTNQMTCCNNNHLIPKSKECCGNNSYDPAHQRCCSDVPNDLSSIRGKSKCCGTKLIRLHDECCNGKHSDLNFQCCDGKFISKSETCCDDRVLEASKICCKKADGVTKQIEKGKASDNACCIYRKNHMETYEPYDEQTQICLKGVFEKPILSKSTQMPTSSITEKPNYSLKSGGLQANNNVACSRKMNSKDLRVIKSKHSNGKLILHVRLEGNLQAGEWREFRIILKEKVHIQVGKMYRIYTKEKIGFTRKFYKSRKDLLIKRNKMNIERFEKSCEVKSVLER